MTTPLPEASDKSTLGLWDVVSLMVGIVVGVTIFKVPGIVFDLAGSPVVGLLIWAVAAVLAFSGALCYAELSTAFPRFGAEYVYLGRAYGRRCGFLFGWMQTFVIFPGSLGAMAFVFADYAVAIAPQLAPSSGWIAAAAILMLTILQWLGFQVGRRAQNMLTTVKVVSLSAVLLCGLGLPSPAVDPAAAATTKGLHWDRIGLALVFVLYAFGGWNDAAAVAPEVRDSRRNMPRALLLGLVLITALYLLLNLSFLRGLGYAGVIDAQAPAAEIIRRSLGPTFSSLMSLIVMTSALGAIHGTMFAGCRLLAAVGEDFPLFRKWNFWTHQHVPVWSLLTLCGTSLLWTALLGTNRGRINVDGVLAALRLPLPDWEKFGGGFEVLVTASAPVFWGFFLLSGLALIVLRIREPDIPRPFRVPWYPFTPLLFTASSGYMLWSSALYAGKLMLLVLPMVLVGAFFSLRAGSVRR